jgi:hypothetical protein
MKKPGRKLGISLVSFGFDPRRTLASLRFLPGYIHDLATWFIKTNASQRKQFPLRLLPTLSDKYTSSGIASGHYFHQDLWAARLIYENAPESHIDVGSRIDGFVAHLLCFREVTVIDIRALSSKVAGLRFLQADMMADKPLLIAPSPSVSCFHALEHFGLGRYGDPLNPDGWRIGMRRLAELVASHGRLYLSVPIGQPSVEFNSQRIYHPDYILEEAGLNGLTLLSFSYVDDAGQFYSEKAPISQELILRILNFTCGCGLFMFSKK